MELYVCAMTFDPDERLWPMAGPYDRRTVAEAAAAEYRAVYPTLPTVRYGLVCSREHLAKWGYPQDEAGDARLESSLMALRPWPRVYPCGCIRVAFGCHDCPEAQELWAKAREAYHQAQESGDYAPYAEARAAYQAHLTVV